MAHLLGAENISLEFPTKQVFNNLTIGVNEGDRIGIVGRNGDGKSTLMKLLSRRMQPDSGRVTHRNDLRIGLLDQADVLDHSLTIGEAVVGDTPEHVWAGNPKVRDVISGLLNDLDWAKPIGQLSGGQRRRVALAALLAKDWDIVMLDEPTNHLDIEGVAWLAEHLNQRWPASQGGLLVVTHDRWFLDAICTLTWEVHDGIIDPFEGGYAAYILQRAERDRSAAASEARRQNLLRKELAWLRRGAPARTSKPKFRIDAANELIQGEPDPRNKLELQKLATARLGKDVIDVEELDYTIGEQQLLNDVTWRIGPGDRVGLVGVNGAGKTTLLRLIQGLLKPNNGRVKLGKTVKIATLSQEVKELQEFYGDRIFQLLAREKTTFVTAGGKEFSPSQLIEQLGFDSAQLQTPIEDLSGGQKRRLQFMRLLMGEPNVLILDEPTNDLDTDMLAAMEDLLDSWPGTLIVVTHDRYLLERVTDMQYALLGDGHLRHLPGGVDEYLKLRRHSLKPEESQTAKVSTEMSGAEKRELEKNLSRIERALEKIAADETELHAQMAAHDQSDYEGLGKLAAKQQEYHEKRENLELEWLETTERLS
ncbi:MAG: ABC-F family ATP-binding cassette domain-containing protein [Micrococcales bacterium]